MAERQDSSPTPTTWRNRGTAREGIGGQAPAAIDQASSRRTAGKPAVGRRAPHDPRARQDHLACTLGRRTDGYRLESMVAFAATATRGPSPRRELVASIEGPTAGYGRSDEKPCVKAARTDGSALGLRGGGFHLVKRLPARPASAAALCAAEACGRGCLNAAHRPAAVRRRSRNRRDGPVCLAGWRGYARARRTPRTYAAHAALVRVLVNRGCL